MNSNKEIISPSDVITAAAVVRYDRFNEAELLENRTEVLEKLIRAMLETLPSEQLLQVYINLTGDSKHHDGYSRATGVRFVAK